jgi:hypothetical protein
MEWPDKSMYQGIWLNDSRVKGKLYMNDGNIYEGEFRDDLMHGVGKISYTQKELVYEGIFKDGNASNIGRVHFVDENQIYIGELDVHSKHGAGILIDKNTGNRYEG